VTGLDALMAEADWSQPIKGYALAARDQGLDGYFECALITEVCPGLWQGGCLDGVSLPDDFDVVISLYGGEKFIVGPHTAVFEQNMQDADYVPDVEDLVDIACSAWQEGSQVLIHCQAGLNRSGFVTAQVLMRRGMTAKEAVAHLRAKRSPMVLCNKTFEQALVNMSNAVAMTSGGQCVATGALSPGTGDTKDLRP
jgi:hypothetical protein